MDEILTKLCCGRQLQSWIVNRYLAFAEEPSLDVEKLMETAQTGDIILFSTRKFSLTHMGGCTPWLHCGMIYRHPDDIANPEGPGSLFLLEARKNPDSMYLQGDDHPLAEKANGPQMVPLRQVFTRSFVEMWGTKWDEERHKVTEIFIGHRRLDCERTPECIRALQQRMSALLNRSFEEDGSELLHAGCSGICCRCCCQSQGENTETLFCSEFVAECLQAMGVLPQDTYSNSISPGDLSNQYGPLWLFCGRPYETPLEADARWARERLVIFPAEDSAFYKEFLQRRDSDREDTIRALYEIFDEGAMRKKHTWRDAPRQSEMSSAGCGSATSSYVLSRRKNDAPCEECGGSGRRGLFGPEGLGLLTYTCESCEGTGRPRQRGKLKVGAKSEPVSVYTKGDKETDAAQKNGSGVRVNGRRVTVQSGEPS